MTKSTHDAIILHQEGKRHVEVGQLKDAQSCLEQALALNPGEPSLALYLANIYKRRNLLDQAESVLLNLIKNYPDSSLVYNNLGGIYYSQQRFKAAQVAYQQAIVLCPDYMDAYYNLGLAFSKDNEPIAAMNAYRQLILAIPTHAAARFQLGCLMMQQADYVSAAEQFLQILEIEVHHVETWINLATCYLRLGRWVEAKQLYLQVLKVADDEQALFNLGVIHRLLGETHSAISYYQRLCRAQQAKQKNSNQEKSQKHLTDSAIPNVDVHYNLALAYLDMNDRQSALTHLQEVLRIEPDHQVVRYMLQVMTTPDSVNHSAPQFVQSLFDGYAQHYDAHMQKTLHYQVPELLHRMVVEIQNEHVYQTILDLGCGTGLCGEWLRPMARTLIGVDLSSAMLAQAASKNKYDELIHDELIAFLKTKVSGCLFDGVIAADVLVYFGDLSMLFELISQVLQPGGWFVFSTEISTKKDYQITTSARFSHHEQYIKGLATQNGLVLKQQKAVNLRKQAQINMRGHVYLLEKAIDLLYNKI